MGNRVPGNKIGAGDTRDAAARGLVPAAPCDSAIHDRTRTLGRLGERRVEEHAWTILDRQLPGRCVRPCLYRAGRSDRARGCRIPWEQRMKRTAQELANYVNGELRGDSLALLESVASLKNAGPADLSYAEEKFAIEVET